MQPIAIVGPTAVGKTGLAIRLAQELDGEIINADVLQAYRHLEIGTAKPSVQERRAVRHHLVDILEPDEPYSAGDFSRRARGAITEIQGRGKLPLVVGGSGFYQRALFEGLSPVPPRDEVIRGQLEQRIAEQGVGSLYAELQEVDPASAARLEPRDRQRICRALEIYKISGETMTAWLDKPSLDKPVAVTRLGLTLPRAILYDLIAARVGQMIERGWIDEVKTLLERGIDPAAPAFQAIGYRQLVSHVRGESSLKKAIDDTIRATRRYAKRQVTWFRHEPNIRWLHADDLDAELPALLPILSLTSADNIVADNSALTNFSLTGHRSEVKG